MRSLAPNAPAVQPAPSNEIETARAISEARRKREQSARFQELCACPPRMAGAARLPVPAPEHPQLI
jgi:hypothetical protein